MEFWLILTIKYVIINISKSFIIKEEKSLRKKYFAYQITLLVVLVLIILFSFVYKNNEKDITADIDPNSNAIRQYYYDSIPGLIRAEQLEMVKPIHKTYNIPDTHYSLKIDRIWYNSRDAFIFYHVENIDQVAYLGGYFIADDNTQTKEIHPRDLVGTSSEKGFFYNNNFYSFLRITPVHSIKEEENDINLQFKPILFIEETEYDFEAINIDLEAIYAEEPIKKFKLDRKIETDEYNLELYELEAGVSYNKIYFKYNGSETETICKIQAQMITDKNEKFEVDKSPILTDHDESRYYIEIEPFNELPDSFDIKIESISLIGSDSIQFTIDTSIANKKKGIHTIKKPLARVINTDIILETLHFKDNHVEIELQWDNADNRDNDMILEMEYLFSRNQKSLISDVNSGNINVPNVITVQNHFGETIEAGSYLYPFMPHDNNINKIYCILPIEVWQESAKIFISIDNITYNKKVNQSFEVYVTPS